MAEIPLLITSAIEPNPNQKSLVMVQKEERLIATKASIFLWASLGQKKIIVCDSTDHKILEKNDISLLKKINVDFEQIKLKVNDDDIISYGKAYGEGKIIDYAIESSTIMSQSDYFFKCTGKYFCRNYETILKLITEHNLKTVFWRLFDRSFAGLDMSVIDTRFFFTSKNFFNNYLSKVYLEKINKSIERRLLNVLDENLKPSYLIKPQIFGISGGNGGSTLELNLGDLDESFPSWVQT